MNGKTVAIIGGYGATGTVMARELARLGYRLVLGGRDGARAQALAASVGAERGVAVDAYDEVSLTFFARGADVLVNCAGPASQIGARVARAAVVEGCHYLDTVMDPSAFEELRGLGAEAARRGRAIVCGGGYVPGLSEILVLNTYAVAKRELDRVTALRLFLMDYSEWSATGVGDLVLRGVFQRPEVGDYRGGRWTPANPLKALTECRLPNGHREQTLPIRWLELTGFAGAHPELTLAVYFPIDLRGLALVTRVALTMRSDLAKATKTLMADMTRRAAAGHGGVLLAEADGARGRTRAKVARLASVPRGRNYFVSGVVGVVAVEQILGGQIKPPGLNYLSDVVDAEAFARRLAELGVAIEAAEPQPPPPRRRDQLRSFLR